MGEDWLLVCVVPTSCWKVLQMVMHYHLSVFLVLRSCLRGECVDFGKVLFPEVHGEYGGEC